MMIRLERATEQHGRDTQTERPAQLQQRGDTQTGTDRWDGVTLG